MKLQIESIPEFSWGHNLAHLLPAPVWDKLRKETYRKAGFKCQVCGTNGKLNCHEVWKYNDIKRIQFLEKVESRCDLCHNINHWGRTVLMVHKGEYPRDYLETLTDHFCKVNKCKPEDFLEEKLRAGELQQYRSYHRYTIKFGSYSKLVN